MPAVLNRTISYATRWSLQSNAVASFLYTWRGIVAPLAFVVVMFLFKRRIARMLGPLVRKGAPRGLDVHRGSRHRDDDVHHVAGLTRASKQVESVGGFSTRDLLSCSDRAVPVSSPCGRAGQSEIVLADCWNPGRSPPIWPARAPGVPADPVVSGYGLENPGLGLGRSALSHFVSRHFLPLDAAWKLTIRWR